MIRALVVGIVLCSLLLSTCSAVLAVQDPWKQNVTIHADKQPLSDVLNDITNKTGLGYIFDTGLADVLGKSSVSVQLDSVPVETALSKILTPLGASYTPNQGVIIITMELANRMKRPVSLEVTNSDLSSVLDQLCKSVGMTYAAESRVASSRVGALKMKNVPFETALSTILKTVDARYRRDGTHISISAPNPYVSTPGASWSFGSESGKETPGFNGSANAKDQLYLGQYKVKNVNPKFVIEAVKKVAGTSEVHIVTDALGKESDIVEFHGTREVNNKALDVAKSVDVPWPTRTLEMKLEIKRIFQPKGQPEDVTVNNPTVFVPDGNEASIQMRLLVPESQKSSSATDTMVNITLQPKVQPDGRIWIQGVYDAKWPAKDGDKELTEVSATKIDIDKIVEAGKSECVVSATTDLGQGSYTKIEISVLVKVTDANTPMKK